MQKLSVRIHRKINNILDKYLLPIRRRHINNCDFSIISNNCWAGNVYRRYGLPYLTPTVGLYFFADDYVKLCSDVKKYMRKELEFIPYTESRYKEIIMERKQTNVPIARLGDIEVIFLHYSTQEEAAQKWKRRAGRINYDNIIFKFSKMDGCTEKQLNKFDQLDVVKKLCFVLPKDTTKIKSGICFKSAEGNEIKDDTSEYSRYINITKLINAKKVCGKHMEGQWNK